MTARILPLLAFAVVFVLGCKDKPVAGPEAPAAVQVPGAAPSAPGQPGVGSAMPAAPKPGTFDDNARVRSTCPEGRLVDGGDTSTPGGTLYLAYQAALKGDSPSAFDTFYGLFIPGKNREEVRRELWPRVIQWAPKYTAAADNAAFTLCRSVPAGDNRVKVYVKCSDPRKSDPPIILENVEGAWKIDVMTP